MQYTHDASRKFNEANSLCIPTLRNVSYNYSADLLFKEITIIYNMLNVSLNDIPIIEREDEL